MNPLFTIDEFNALVEKLAQSADDLSARFGQVRTLDTQARLVGEEMLEWQTATDFQNYLEELGDVLVTLGGLLVASGQAFAGDWLLRREARPCLNDEALVAEVCVLLQEAQNGGIILARWQRVLGGIYLLAQTTTGDEFRQQVARVVTKNATKTNETHYLDTTSGKIRRRDRNEVR